MRCRSLPFSSLLACLAALATLGAPLADAQSRPPLDAAAAGQAEKEIRQLLTSFYETYAKEDLAALVGLWHPGGPGRSARNIVELEFELRDATLRSVAVRDFSVDAGGGRARVIVEMGITERKTGRSRTERRVREMTFLQDNTGAWKVWNEATSGMMLAARLLSVPAAERPALLEAETELASDDTLASLGMEANRRRSQGGMIAVLDAISARELVARALHHEHALASCLLDAGLIYQVTGSLDEAGRKFAEARDLFARAGTPLEVANLDANLAAVDYLAGRHASALARFEQALQVYETEGDNPRVASLLHGIGNTLYMQGQFERALEAYGRTRTLTETAGNKVGAASALLAIALVHKELGNYTQAGEAYGASAVLSAEIGDHTGTAKALHGQGEVHRLQGDHALALEAFHKALQAWARTADPPNRAATLFAIGQVHAAERSFPAAADWYQQALDVDTRAGDRAGVARDTGGLAGAHFAMGQADVALTEYERSLELREQLKDVPGVTWTLVHVGVLHVSQQRHAEALKVYLRAIALAEQEGDQSALGVAHALKGSAELASGSPEQALESLAKAVTFAERTEEFDTLAFARTVEGKAHGEAGRAPQARDAFDKAIQATLRVPSGPGAETFFTDRWGPHLGLADLLVKQGDAAGAVDALERGRQQALANMLGPGGAVVTKGLSDAEREEEQGLTKAVRGAVVKLRRERGRKKAEPEREAALRQDVEKLTAQRDELRARLFVAHPDLRVLRAQAEPMSLSTLPVGLLRPGDAVLTFAVTESKTHVLVARVARDPARALKGQEPAVVPVGAPQTGRGDAGSATPGMAGASLTVHAATVEVAATDLAGRVARFRDALRQIDPGADTQSSELYALLLLPVESHLAGATRLLIVPDAMLWGLPFEALYGTGRYMMERAPISYAPSLSAFAAASQLAPAKPSGRLFALGAPVLTKAAEERVARLRPGQKVDAGGTTERETRGVLALAGPARSQGLLGPQATVDRLADAVPEGSVVHLAAPVFLSDASPLHSLLALSASKADDTGLVEVGDALHWEARAAAAVFPAVQGSMTGLSGEALTGLSWSLLVAGTPSVALGRWPLGAKAPARVAPLLAAFYRARLSPNGESLTVAQALQRAARRLLASPATKHPGHWAGLMVIGK